MSEPEFNLNACFSTLLDVAPNGQYAMWWPSENDASYTTTPSRQAIRRAYAALDGIETSILGVFMAMAGEEETGVRVALPRETVTRYFQDETGAPFLLSVSVGKGMRFHFHSDHTAPIRRDAFWQSLAQGAEAWRIGLAERGAVPATPDPPQASIPQPTEPAKPGGLLGRLFGRDKPGKPQETVTLRPMNYWETVDRIIVETEASSGKSEAVGTIIVG